MGVLHQQPMLAVVGHVGFVTVLCLAGESAFENRYRDGVQQILRYLRGPEEQDRP